ncbi:MAG: hypothetical protein MUC35_06860 [Candidatus Margulisbacteria bacterium]|jgi:F-type H+-transporting ATPase subunit epsilon|nr:hypothetical protein [Candidatus Margulisiibacteriota bacterium]
MKDFALEIRSAEKALFLGRVISLDVPASDGRLGVLADHAPLAAELAPGALVYKDPEGTVARVEGEGGFLIVKQNSASVLLANPA